MKTAKRMLLGLATAAIFVLWSPALAAAPAPPTGPVIVSQNRDQAGLQRQLGGLPDNLRNLILTFDQSRRRYLESQRLLESRLQTATTPEEEREVRRQLQANRADFLAELKTFREDLRADLDGIRGKVAESEFLRVIAAAHDSTGEGSHRHRGQ